MTNINSNAYNFSEYITSGVDPRTGMFSMQLNLGNFISYQGSGISLPLILSYSPATTADEGFGQGWNLPFSQFNKNTNTLQLSSGQSFKIKWNDEKKEYDMSYRKLKDIRVLYIEEDSEIKIIYKNGEEEYLDYDDGYTKKRRSKQGLDINFEYELFKGRKTLWRISDNNGCELEIDWWSDDYTTIVEHKFNSVSYQTLIFDKYGPNYKLRYFSVKGDDGYTDIEYKILKPSNYNVITKVTHSSYFVEEIFYVKGHYLQPGAPFERIPCVKKHIKYPGENQNIQIIEYSFSNKNYLGFGSEKKWSSTEDNLFQSSFDYKYMSEELINEKRKITRHYNKYHLNIIEEHSFEGRLYKKIENVFYANTELTIEHQPAQYSLLKEQHITSYDNSKQKTIKLQYEYDEYANLIFEMKSDGTTIKTEYYPVSGEEGFCPIEPNGMISLIKKETFTPASNHKDLPRVTTKTYEKILKIDGIEEYFITLKSEEYLDTKTEISCYQERGNTFSHGRMKNEKHYFNNIMLSEILHEYTVGDDNIEFKQSTTIFNQNGEGNIEFNTKSFTEMKHQKVIKEIDNRNRTVDIKYDLMGREREVIHHKDLEEYKSSVQTEYFSSESNHIKKETDPNGNLNISYYNNAGNLIRSALQLNGKTEQCVMEMIYDDFGMIIKKIETDWLTDQEKMTPLITKFEYDDHGEINKTIHPDGRVELIIQNLVDLTTTHIQKGLISVVMNYDLSGNEIKKETKSSDGTSYSVSTSEYDGYGNKIKITDTVGNVITSKYDKHDRIISVSRNIENSNITETYSYPPNTADSHINEIKINNMIIGEREYDPLFRITREKSVGVITKYTYYGISNLPLTISKPRSFSDSNVISFTYDPVSLLPLTQTTIPDQSLNITYKYNKKKGLLLETLNPNSKNIYQYDNLNRLIKESINLNNNETTESSFEYTLLGKALSEVDFFHGKKEITYDDYSRPKGILQKIGEMEFETKFEYDEYSRANKVSMMEIDSIREVSRLNNKVNNEPCELYLEFNPIGVETSRYITRGDKVLFIIDQKYNESLLITSRTFISNNKISVETFEYDKLHRLSIYLSAGENSPKDEKGNTISKQTFSHDIYGNIIKAVSIFTDDQTNTSTFTYTPESPTVLGRIQNTHPQYTSDFECKYDFTGNLSNDEDERLYAFNALGQLDTVYINNGNTFLTSYHYNANGDLVSQKYDDQSIAYFYYINGSLTNELKDNVVSTYSNHGVGFKSHNVNGRLQYLLGNCTGSILSAVYFDENGIESDDEYYKYTPFGEG